MNVKMVYLLTTVLVSMMTALSSASRSAHLDNYIRIRNNYLIPLARAASEAYNASFDDAFKVIDYYGLNGGFCHADDILRIYYSLEPMINEQGPLEVAKKLYELDRKLDMDESLVKKTFDTYKLFTDSKWITPAIVHECLKLSHHVDNFLGLKNFVYWTEFNTREELLYAVVMYLLEFPGLEKHDRFILQTASNYRFKDGLPTNCTIFRALSNWHLLKDDLKGLNELDTEFVKLKELLEEHPGSMYHLGGSRLANISYRDDHHILTNYLLYLMELPAPSPMSDISNMMVDRVLDKLDRRFYRDLVVLD